MDDRKIIDMVVKSAENRQPCKSIIDEIMDDDDFDFDDYSFEIENF